MKKSLMVFPLVLWLVAVMQTPYTNARRRMISLTQKLSGGSIIPSGLLLVSCALILSACGDSRTEDTLAEIRAALVELGKVKEAQKGADGLSAVDVAGKITELSRKISALEAAMPAKKDSAKLDATLRDFQAEIGRDFGYGEVTVASSNATAIVTARTKAGGQSSVVVYLSQSGDGDWRVITPKELVLEALLLSPQGDSAISTGKENVGRSQVEPDRADGYWDWVIQSDGSKKLIFHVGARTTTQREVESAPATGQKAVSGGAAVAQPPVAPAQESVSSPGAPASQPTAKPNLREITNGHWETKGGRRVFVPNSPR